MHIQATRLARWQGLTVGLMVVGYAGFYLCRSNLSATLPLIIDDLARRGMDPSRAKSWLGWAMSLGTIAYALGKFAAGSLTDLLGGRRNYLLGMAGAVVCTIVLALGGPLPVFTMAWFSNRLIQSLGWPGMIKITSRWFSFSSYGTVMGVISLSFLFGDALARTFMGWLITDWGFGWQGVFWIAAGVLAVILIANVVLIRESPGELGLPEPAANPENLFGKLGQEPHPESARSLWATLAGSQAFWTVCLLSLGLTLLARDVQQLDDDLPGTGGGPRKRRRGGEKCFVSSCGRGLGDSGGLSGRPTGTSGTSSNHLWWNPAVRGGAGSSGLDQLFRRPRAALALVVAVGFLLIGPYSYMAGAISLDFGGKRGGATACGIIDGVGYLFGGVVAGNAVARISDSLGWQGVFFMLAGVAGTTGLVAAWFLVSQLRVAGG